MVNYPFGVYNWILLLGVRMLRLLICVFLISSFLVLPVHAAAKAGKVVSVKGEVYILSGLKKKALAKVGDTIFVKDKVKTSKTGELVFDNGSAEITVGPGSYMKIPASSGGETATTKLSMTSGSLKFKVNKLNSRQSFTVKTPSAVAGVRGTEGEITYSEGVTGCQSLPHTDGGSKSIVYTAEPGDEAKLNAAIQSSREAEESGGKQNSIAPIGVVIVNEGQASFTLPDGSAILIDIAPGTTLKDMVKRVVQEIKKDASAKAVKDKNAQNENMSSEQEERLQNLIRLINVSRQAERARTELPGVPSLPAD